MTLSFDEARDEALECLEWESYLAAWEGFGQLLNWPGQLEDRAQWQEGLALLGRIAAEVFTSALATHLSAAADAPDDAEALYRLGYALVADGQAQMAATVLARAHALRPDSEKILVESIAALELFGAHTDAARMLQQAPPSARRGFLPRYLLGFNLLLSGDVDAARAVVAGLGGGSDDAQQRMCSRLDAMLFRHDAVRGVTTLDHRDLRGWHYVVSGGLLLHQAPVGDASDSGRYRYLEDSERHCAQAIRLLGQVLSLWGEMPERILTVDQRHAKILAQAAATILGGLPVELVTHTEKPGLLIAYDWEMVIGEISSHYHTIRPGQLVWGHASCWTRERPFVADITTFLYQKNVSPWDRHTIWAADRTDLPDGPPTGSDQQLGAAIVAAAASPDPEHATAVLALAKVIGALRGELGTSGLQGSGRREKQWVGSPVDSRELTLSGEL